MQRSLALVLLAAGCSDSTPAAGPLGGSLLVEGAVHDFKSGQLVDGGASISTSGLLPPPTVTMQGATFALDGVPENSVFHVLAAVPPTHHATFGPAVEVTAADRDGIVVPAVSEAFLGELSTAFGVSPAATHGMLLVQIVDANNQPRGALGASSLSVDAGADVKGPYFLDATIAPAPGATMTSAAGWVVYFDVAPGVVGLTASASASVTLDMPLSPVNAGAVTVVRAQVTNGTFMPPTDVSFQGQVFPIFRDRGCVACHEEGNGPGRDLGNLTLNTDPNLVYNELVNERPNRVIVADPDASLLLSRPLREDPPDVHPNITFTSTLDPDYQLIRAWIAEGAKQN